MREIVNGLTPGFLKPYVNKVRNLKERKKEEREREKERERERRLRGDGPLGAHGVTAMMTMMRQSTMVAMVRSLWLPW